MLSLLLIQSVCDYRRVEMCLTRVCGVLDLETFAHKQLVLYREIGYSPLIVCENCDEQANNYVLGVHVYPSFHPPYSDTSLWKTFNTIKFKITGLSLLPDRNEPYISHDEVLTVIRSWYEASVQGERNIIAYKGGNHEKNLLTQLQIPSLDLNDYDGFPSFKDINDKEYVWYQSLNCGQHRFLDPIIPRVNHCPRMEAAFYRNEIQRIIHEVS